MVAKSQGDRSASQSSMKFYYPWISGPLRVPEYRAGAETAPNFREPSEFLSERFSQRWIPKLQFWYPPLRFGSQHRTPKPPFLLVSGKTTIIVATIHPSPFTGKWFTDFLFIHSFSSQQEGSFHPFTHSLGHHGRMLHSLTPFKQVHSSNHANSGY